MRSTEKVNHAITLIRKSLAVGPKNPIALLFFIGLCLKKVTTCANDDLIVFKYSPMHNVVEVGKSDYDSCQATTIVQAFSDGNTVIPLKAAGKRYFICGTPGHCSMGMKLAVNTLATTASSPPPKAASPPLSGTSPSPAAGSPEAAAAPAPSTTPPLSSDAPSSSDDIPSALPVAPSSSQARETALAPSSAPARGGFRDGLVMGLFGVAVMVLTF